MKSFLTILLATLAGVACASNSISFSADDLNKETTVADTMLERADVNHDTCLDAGDLMIVLAAFGTQEHVDADINNDNIVDQQDAFLILYLYSTQCEGF